MNWQIIASKSAQKNLRKFPIKDANKIREVIQVFLSNPYFGDVKKLKGREDIWRKRVGDYRIIYEINERKDVIYILEIKHQSSKTY